MGDDKVKSGTGIELTRDQEEFLREADAEEERIRREVFSTSEEDRRAELLNRYYPPEYFRSPPSGFLVACWVQSRENSSAAENPAEKQYWDYQVRGFADEISRRLSEHPTSQYVLNSLYDCQDCYRKLLKLARKNMPGNIRKTDELWLNANNRLGHAMITEGNKAIREQSLVRGVFDERVGILRPKYAFIAVACDGYFDYLQNALVKDLINELNKKHPQERSSIDPDEALPRELDISRLHEVERVSALARWLETIKDPLDRDIAKLLIQAPTISIREIADELSLSKSDVGRRIKKLNPPF